MLPVVRQLIPGGWVNHSNTNKLESVEQSIRVRNRAEISTTRDEAIQKTQSSLGSVEVQPSIQLHTNNELSSIRQVDMGR